jgi:transcriptional regulator with XRE-family HTH domain
MASNSSRILELMLRLSRLRELRMKAALTQAELAALSGVARGTIMRLERGEPNPIPSTIRKLAAALNVKPAALF